MEKNDRVIPQIKICGLTRTKEAAYLNQIHAQYAGFVFWENSKRYVDIAQAEEICRCLDKNIMRVAEGHLDLYRKLDDAQKIDNEKEMIAIRVNILETELRKVKERLEQIA